MEPANMNAEPSWRIGMEYASLGYGADLLQKPPAHHVGGESCGVRRYSLGRLAALFGKSADGILQRLPIFHVA